MNESRMATTEMVNRTWGVGWAPSGVYYKQFKQCSTDYYAVCQMLLYRDSTFSYVGNTY